MRNLRGTYVHRGDLARRRQRIRRSLYTLGVAVAVCLVVVNRKPAALDAEAAVAPSSSGFFSLGGESRDLRAELETAKGELSLARAQLERSDKIIKYSSRYGIAANLATNIVDAAAAEGIDPELGFRLVSLESEFNPRATSPVGAVGLTQLMPGTARDLEKGITHEKLYDPKVNLRLGFRYLRGLIAEYHGNARLALLVYNRGPAAVKNDQNLGINPSNGYEKHLMKGYRGKGVVN